MSLAINHNMLAINARYSLDQSYKNMETSTGRLSSGLRINTSADDAAGLAIREIMRADISTIHQGIRNANDGISMIQTADGALGLIDTQLIRMKELAQQASTGTYNASQREFINQEYQKLAAEITRISEGTEFNNLFPLKGYQHNFTVHNATPVTAGTATVDTATKTIDSIGIGDTIAFANKNKNGFTVTTTATFSEAGSGTAAPVKATYVYNEDGTTSVTPEKPSAGAKTLVSSETYSLSKQYEPSEATSVSYEISKDGGKSWEYLPATGKIQTKAGEQLRVTASYPRGQVTETFVDPSSTDPAHSGDDGNIVFEFDADTHTVSYKTVPKHTVTPPATLTEEQVNENTAQAKKDLELAQFNIKTDSALSVNFAFGTQNDFGDNYSIHIGKVSARSLNIGVETGDNLLTKEGALESLERLKEAMLKIENIHAHIGATQNRLSASIDNISIQRENAQASESRISDVDVANEMMLFTSRQLQANAAMAMLVQANSLPETARRLLQGS
jgi:flagellin